MKKNIAKLLVMLILVSTFSVIAVVDGGSGVAFADVPSGNGIQITEEGGLRTVLVYDDFNASDLNNNIWNSKNNIDDDADYNVDSGELYTKDGISALKLRTPRIIYKGIYETDTYPDFKGYNGYDHYEIQLDIVDLDVAYLQESNGGIGISKGGKVYSFNERMEYNDFYHKYFRSLNLTEYNSISSSNPYGDELRGTNSIDTELRGWYNPRGWGEKEIRLLLNANKKTSGVGYDIQVSVFIQKGNGGFNKNPDKIFEYDITDELDFKNIFITDIEPSSAKTLSFDNFYLKATKDIEVEMLKASWQDDVYKLEWDAIEDATEYVVYYYDGSNKVEYTRVSSTDTRVAFVDDDSALNKKKFVVEANVPGNTRTSNVVSLGGDISSAFGLSGVFRDSDFDMTWSALDIDDSPSLTYTLMYGDSELEINSIVEGADELGSDDLSHTIEKIQSSDQYYGKFFQVVANVDFGIYGETQYKSEVLLGKSDVKLNVNHVDDYFIFNWDYEPVYTSYNLYKSDVESGLKDLDNLPENPDGFVFSDAIGGRILHKVLDSSVAYSDKYFLLEGRFRGDSDYSAILKTDSNVVTPTLSWSKNNEGKQTFAWSEMTGATKVELYSGDSAAHISTLINKDTALLSSHKFETVLNAYEDAYAQVRFYKNDIWYYSNIVKTNTLIPTSTIVEKTIEGSSDIVHDLEMDWSDLTWAEDGTDDGRRSYYRVYYINGEGAQVEIQTNLETSAYTIEDIYGKNKDMLRKSVYVESVCSVQDEFGLSYGLVVQSSPVVPREITFNTLSGDFDTDRNYSLTWSVPVELNVDTQDFTVERYDLSYGNGKNNILTEIDSFSPPYTDLVKVLSDVQSDGEGAIYYHKFFGLKAVIDHITYYSNTRYSEDALLLSVKRFDDDFTFEWDRMDNADKIKIYYADAIDGEYSLYEPAELAGSAIKHTIEDLDDVNKEFNKKYFKAVAIFDKFEIDSNSVYIDVTQALPKINGEFKGDVGSYELTWEAVGWITEGYKLYYEERTTEDEVTTVEYKEITTLSDSTLNYTFTNVATNEYKEKFVRIAAVDGALIAFSNAVFVEDPTIEGSLEGKFNADDVEVKVGNSSDIVYKFKVYKEMKDPYIEIELNGSPYLDFSKTQATLEKTKDDTSETVPIRLATEIDETNGITSLYVYVSGDNPEFLADGDIEYTLAVKAAITLNDKKADEVYDALVAKDEALKNWSLPYHIADLEIDGKKLDEGMFIRYEAHWNVDDSVSTEDERHTSKELFNIDLDVKNKNVLPSSM